MSGFYMLLKVVHVVAAIVLIGNIVVTAVWKTLADRTRDAGIVAFAQRLVTITDLVFTGPAALLLLMSGTMAAVTLGAEWFRLPWIHSGFALFALSGLLWAALLIPIQLRQARLARAFAAGGEIPEGYWKLCRFWRLVGVAATLLLLVAVAIMVYKPA